MIKQTLYKTCQQRNKCAKLYRLRLSNFSSDSNTNEKQLIYSGPFESKIKMLRRVSLTSSIVSTMGLPMINYLGIGGGNVAEFGKIAISGTVILASLSSTFFLNIICKPYVTKMYTLSSSDSSNTNTAFEVERINIVGSVTKDIINIKDIEYISASIHPFATFRVKSSFYYIYPPNFKNEEYSKLFSKKQ